MLDCRPRPLLLRGAERRARLTAPMIKQGGQWQRGRLGHRAGVRGRCAQAPARPSTALRDIGALGSAAQHGGRTAPARQAGARPGQREHRPPPAPQRLRQPRAQGQRALAGHCRSRRCRRSSACWWSGSFLRKDHPLFAQRIRQAVRRGGKVISLHAVHDDWADARGAARLTRGAERLGAGAGRRRRCRSRRAKGVAAPDGRRSAATAPRRSPQSLLAGERKAILLGNAAAQHPQASQLLAPGAMDRRADRRQRRLPGRGRQHGGRATGRRDARAGRPECRRRCWRSR